MARTGKVFWRNNGIDYNKTALVETVRTIINNQPLYKEFESDLLPCLFGELHYWHSLHSGKPTKFRKARPQPGHQYYDFQAYFPELDEWDSTSWHKCIDGYDINVFVKRELRKVVDPIILAYKVEHVWCERCKSAPSTEVDHVNPEFSVLAEQALSLVSPKELEQWWDKLTAKDSREFELPRNHAAVLFITKAHQDTTQLMAVCKQCHLINARERKEVE